MKQHRLLKCLMPLLGCVYGFATIYLCGVIGGDASRISWLLPLRLAAQIAFIALTVWIIRKPLTHLFPQVARYEISLPAWHTMVMILLVTPLWCILKGRLLHLAAPDAEMSLMTYAADELLNDLILSLSAVFIGPVYEEMCFRYLPLAAFRRKGTQLVVGVLVAMFFGLLHTSNMLGSFVDALIFTLVLILTGKIGLSMVVHGCINLWPMVFCVLVHFGLLEIQHSPLPVIWLIGDEKTLIAAVVLALIGIGIYLIVRQKSNLK